MSYLLNYADRKFELDDHLFDDIENVAVATVRVDTGDETLTVVRRNGEKCEVSTFSALFGCYDGEYDIIKDGHWVIDREVWDKRKSSYEILYGE